MSLARLQDAGVVRDVDPLTGAEPALAFPGWVVVEAGFQRWKRDAPFMLENAIEARLELLADAEGDRAAFLHTSLELALAVRAGVRQ